VRIVVIGAGFGGVAAAALLRAGFTDLLVVDRGSNRTCG
jgi:cation diffusion facilitator CzcD-associated flavoprotein CzcO